MPLRESKSNYSSQFSYSNIAKQTIAQLSPLAIVLALAFFSLFSLNTIAAPALVLSKDQSSYDLIPFSDILLDTTKSLTVESMLDENISRQFTPLKPTQILSRQDSRQGQRAWLRFTLQSPASTQQYWLTIAGAKQQEVRLFYQNANGEVIEASSPVIPTSPIKVINSPNNASTVYWLCLEDIQLQHLDIRLSKPERFISEKIQQQTIFNFSLAGFSTLLIVCLLLAISSKNKTFIYLSSYIGCIIVLISIGIEQSPGNIQATLLASSASFILLAILAFGFYALSLHNYVLEQHFLLRAQYQHISPIMLFFIISLLVFYYLDTPYSLLSAIAVSITSLPTYYLYLCYRKTLDRITLFLIYSRIVIAILLSLPFFGVFTNYHLSSFVSPFSLFVLNLDALCLFAAFYFSHLKKERNKTRQQLLSRDLPLRSKHSLNKLLNQLKTPTNTISNTYQLLQESKLSQSQQQLLENINASTQELTNHIADLSQQANINKEQAKKVLPFEIRALIEECISSHKEALKGKSIDIITDIDEDIASIVEGNASYLRQVINTLLANAIRYTQEGTITLHIHHFSKNSDQVTFTVSDTGRGIDRNTLLNLKEHPNNISIHSDHSSISLVKLLLSQLHTRLEINSQLGEGSEFSFTVILPESRLAKDLKPANFDILQDKQVLIVNSNHAFSRTLKLQAQRWGCAAFECFDGTEAMAMFRAKKNLQEHFQLIIVDEDLAHLNGIEVAKRIRSEAEDKPLIVMLSNQLSNIDKNTQRQAGIDIVLEKPVSQRMLKSTIANLLQNPDKHLSNKANKDIKVLIAEDNDVSRRVISKMMELLDIRYKTVSNGKLATDAAYRERFDLILMDCEMPLMDGFAATEAIHKHQHKVNQRPTPIIALTAHVFDENKQRSEQAGMAGFLEKPIQMNDLNDIIERFS